MSGPKIQENFVVTAQQLRQGALYSDRNGVYHKAKGVTSQQVVEAINKLNHICGGRLKVVSNESEDPKKKVLNADKSNGVNFDESNYHLSTESAARFIQTVLKSNKCFFVGGEEVALDVKLLGLDIINLSKVSNVQYLKPLLDSDIPVLFARPPFAINARHKDEQSINKGIWLDNSLENVSYLLRNSSSKVVFCHSKLNCNRTIDGQDFRELNLGYYFDYLLKNFGLKVGESIFDLGKGGHSNGEIFDVSLDKSNTKDYSNVIGIGDMLSDIEHNVKNGGTGVLVTSGDEVFSDELCAKIEQYGPKIVVIKDITNIQVQ